jgi:hypothetical protein
MDKTQEEVKKLQKENRRHDKAIQLIYDEVKRLALEQGEDPSMVE